MSAYSLLGFSCLVILLCLVPAARSDLASDQAECANQLVGLATCLPYVQGNAKAPTPDCCSGLKAVLDKSPKCLCILIKDRDDPQLGIKINATLAASLPPVCNAPANISNCPRLLNLPPNSAEAQVFKQFGSPAAQGNATGTGNSNSTGARSGSASAHATGGGVKNYLWGRIVGSEVVMVVLLLLLPLVVLNG